MNPGTISNITWARCGITSLVGATHCPCFEPSRVLFGERTNYAVFVYEKGM